MDVAAFLPSYMTPRTRNPMTATPLKLIAFDADDLAVLSAHLQDAVLKASDIAFMARTKQFAFVCNRFDWEAADGGERQRRRTGVRIERVTKVSARAVPKGSDAVLELLALRFEPGDEPGGTIELVFAGDAGLRLAVECVEAAMDDLGPMWSTDTKPDHGAA
jgi:Protein of unknown function (DUF2948)